MNPFRTEVQQYSSICELLLTLAGLKATISQEETDIILYYSTELRKTFHHINDL